jgi:phosphoribosylanthranilate isomerase
MKAVRVKICGITRREDLVVAEDAGADAVGFVVGVATSPRNLTLEKAKEIRQQALDPIEKFAVTVPTSIDFLVKLLEELRPDAIQIHGEHIQEAFLLRETLLGVRLIKAVSAKPRDAVKAAITAAESFDAVLLDSFVHGKNGGTGVVHDWELSKRVRDAIHPTPLILAGGLTPENVKVAVQFVQPYCVDVSSGVELRPGVKDPEKVFKFVRNAKGEVN